VPSLRAESEETGPSAAGEGRGTQGFRFAENWQGEHFAGVGEMVSG